MYRDLQQIAGDMELDTISDEQRATIQRQSQMFGLGGALIALFIYFAIRYGFSHASEEFISHAQNYLINPPDFSKCHPLFTARVVGHYIFLEISLVLILMSFIVFVVKRAAVFEIERRRAKIYISYLLLISMIGLPLFSGAYLAYGRISVRIRFEDFCASSWDPLNNSYQILMYAYLFMVLFGILGAIVGLVFAFHGKSFDALSDDLHVAAEQLCVRLEMGTIDQETFDATARKLGLMK